MPDQARYEEVTVDGNDDTRRAVTQNYRAVDPGRILGGLIGLILAVVGVVAIAKCGIDGSLDKPVANVLGMDQSAIVGLVEFALGLLMILGAASSSTRSFMGGVGVLALIAGVVAAASTASVRSDIGMDTGAGWFVAICGALVLAASFIGTYAHSRREVRTMSGTPRFH
jgi:hypothetical protein